MNNNSPIAVVGISAIFPGSVNISGFWNNIVRARDLIQDVPETHWLIEDFYHPDATVSDKSYGKRGGFLDEIEFDCREYGILPSQVQDIDTIQLLSMIVAQNVLNDATKNDFSHVDRNKVSVILGSAGGTEKMVLLGARLQRPVWLKSLRDAGIEEEKAQEICDRIANHYHPWTEASFPGLLSNVIAGRIANRFDLGGTNCVVDAACASSSSAVSMAVNELYQYDSDLVITGGADNHNDIGMYMSFSKVQALSPTGNCRPFSSNADGTILGEGIGMVALRRLEDAERDGDTIYAIIRSVGSSSDGSGTAIYSPVDSGQAKAISKAYRKAQFDPATIELIEAHGTGTQAGDAAEFDGLRRAFSESQIERKQWCALGSIKSQIGHTKAAAGAAALIKTVLALHHKVLPPTINVEKPHPKFNIESSPFYLNSKARPWIRGTDHPRRAGVSSFGFGGSNFHIALEEYTGVDDQLRLTMVSDHHLILVSSNDLETLFAKALECVVKKEESSKGSLERSARSSQTTFNAEAPFRLAFVVKSFEELSKAIASSKKTVLQNPEQSYSFGNTWFYAFGEAINRVAFIFPGQGSQYANMGADIAMTFPWARKIWDLASDLSFDSPIKLHQIVFPTPSFEKKKKIRKEDQLRETQWAQPAIAAVSLSQMSILSKLGLFPNAVAGHSLGELTALCTAGMFAQSELLSIARKRGDIMANVSEQTSGAMTAITTDKQEVEELLSKINGSIRIANINAPEQIVISGEVPAVLELEEACSQQQMQFYRLPVSTAFHSPIVETAVEPFRDYLSDISFAQPNLSVYSNNTAGKYPNSVSDQKDLLARQLASPVLFKEMIESMHEDGIRLFLEVGPADILTKLTARTLKNKPHAAIALDKKDVNGLTSLWRGLAQLSICGISLDYSALWDGFSESAQKVDEQPAPINVKISGTVFNKSYPPKGGAKELPKPNIGKTETPHESQIEEKRYVTDSDDKTGIKATSWLAAFENIQRETNEAHRQFLKLSEYALKQLGNAPGEISEKRIDFPPGPSEEIETSCYPSAERTDQVLGVVNNHDEERIIPVDDSANKQHSSEELTSIIMRVVSEKTGYPEDVLDLSMDMDSDLGIDSIKRVEILSATLEFLPNNVEVETSDLSSARTLQQVVDEVYRQFKQQGKGLSTESDGEINSQNREVIIGESTISLSKGNVSNDIETYVLSAVSEKTGYPIDILDLEMDLEFDLGIDSIKRVEILSAATEQMSDLPVFEIDELAELKTLREIVDYFKTIDSNKETKLQKSEKTGGKTNNYAVNIKRYEIGLVPCERAKKNTVAIKKSSSFVITPAQSPYSVSLAKELELRGFEVDLKDNLSKEDKNSISLEGLQTFNSIDDAIEVNKAVFKNAQQVAAIHENKAGSFFVVQNAGGDFSQQPLSDCQPWSAGLSGLVKSAAQEWPSSDVRSIDLDSNGRDTEDAVKLIADELLVGKNQIESVIAANNERFIHKVKEAKTYPGKLPINPHDVLVITGGGKGITAASIIGLCEQIPLKIAVLGRTELNSEESGSLDLGDEFSSMDDSALMQRIVEFRKEQQLPHDIGVLRKEVQGFKSRQEIERNLEKIRSLGSEVEYLVCDITTYEEVDSSLTKIVEKWGGIDGVIHGAGVLADNLLSKKTVNDFDSVFSAKVKGLANLMHFIDFGTLKCIVLFSSIAARFGNAGQSDYAMANEVLNRVANFYRNHKGTNIISINWGPWDGGMVTSDLKSRFERTGIGLIPLKQGVDCFIDELRNINESTEVIIVCESEKSDC